MNLGYHCRNWGPGGFINALKDISDLGYEGFEAFSTIVSLYEDRLNVFKEIVTDLHLQMAAIQGVGSFIDPSPESIAEDVEHNMNTARFIKENGSEILVLSGAPKPENKKQAAEAWDVFLDIISEIGQRCYTIGVKCCFHPGYGSLLETRRDIDKLMKKTKTRDIGLCVDTGSLARSGVNIRNLLKDYKKRIHMVHLKDCMPRRVLDKKKNKRIRKMTSSSEYCELGKGGIDFVKIADTLHDIKYEGWVIVELDSPKRQPYDSAKISVNYARKNLGIIV